MTNADALRTGTAKAKKIIEQHMFVNILIPMAERLVKDATDLRTDLGHNMTGNTVNAYVAGVYIGSTLAYVETSGAGIAPPLRVKLRLGEIYPAGSPRWDGAVQEGPFKAPVDTDRQLAIGKAFEFLQSFKPTEGGYTLVVCNGVEYAEFQENAMNIDVLTRNLNNARTIIPSMFKPIPE